MAKKENRHAELVSASANIEAPYELPDGWKWEKLGNYITLLRGVSYKKDDAHSEKLENDCLIMRGGNIVEGSINLESDNVYVDKSLVSENQLIKKYDIIIVTSTGSTKVIGRAGVSKDNYNDVAFGAFLTLARPNDLANKSYINQYFQSSLYRERIRQLASGVNINNIRSEYITETPIPLPSTLTEQERIVNRIETMFAKLDQAQEKAQAVLDSFETRKAAILHKAFTGQLKIDNEELTIEDWEDTTIGECIKLFSGQDFKPEDYNAEENGIPYITGASNFAENHVLINRWTSKPSVIAKKDDVLLVCKGSGYGKTIIADFEEAHIARQIMALRIPKNISNRFILYFLQNNYEYLRNGGQGLIPGIARNIVLQMPIKVPPLNYQLSIVNFLDTVLEKESRAKEAAQTVLDQIALLKKSILARAFRGEL